ncbi:MAG: hemerythrin domain-containing protein [Vulcanimicrobiota bacterium]
MASSIRQLTQERPWVARLLTAYGLDPNCPGPLPGNPELQMHLRQIWNGPEDLRRLSPPELLDYIVHCHHRYLRRVLPRLIQLATSLGHPILPDLQALLHEGYPHMFREEVEVFPAIREICTENRPASHLPRWIARLELEHERTLERFFRIRQLLAQPHEDRARPLLVGLAELDEDMRWHMYAENELLFSRVLKSA